MPEPCWIAGNAFTGGDTLAIRSPWNGEPAGEVALAGPEELERAIAAALKGGKRPTRWERAKILEKAADLLDARVEEHAQLILRETGLSLHDTRAEAARAGGILRVAAMEALRDEGVVTPGDVTAAGFARKMFTIREPAKLVAAITPFNHPLTQCAHKVAPAIAAGAPVILKPSDKTPLIAMKFAAILYEAGLPGWMLSCFTGPLETVVEPLIRDPRVEALTFTGSAAVGKKLPARAGYKRLALELGGNSEMIVLEDADLDLAARLGCAGSYSNSGQRCTAVKRFLVHRSVAEEFTERLTRRTLEEWKAGDPADLTFRVGAVITEAAAKGLEEFIRDAVDRGAELRCGGTRAGALLEPTVLANVPRDARLMREEAFGPLSPVVVIDDLDDALNLVNASPYGLSTAVMTNSLRAAQRVVAEADTGMVHVNEVPAWRLEHTPFGGVKDSGLGIKEGVREAMAFMSRVKSFSLPWECGSL